MWTAVTIGKHAGKGHTLPQILFKDPDWFFWACRKGIFNSALTPEAETIHRRAKAIILPENYVNTHCVQHWLSRNGKYSHFELIPRSQGQHNGSSKELRSDVLDLEFTYINDRYDKLGANQMIKKFKFYWFNDKNLTKQRVQDFFDDTDNFRNP